MTEVQSFSLDTPATDLRGVHSGYNFREVAPELLSPLSWSIIGAGMEQGFRAAAARFGPAVPAGSRPHFVSYFGFRPFFNMTSIERVCRQLPFADPEDIWELLLGGPGPEVNRPRRAVLPVRLTRMPDELRFLWSNGPAFGQAQALLAEAEQLVLRAVAGDSAWTKGAAVEAAVRAGRAAWALHIRTTCVALMTAALFRRALRLRYPDRVALELLSASAQRRSDGAVASARGGALGIALDRLNNYEVADGCAPFAQFSTASLAAAATRQPPELLPAVRASAGLAIPLGTALGPLFERLETLVGLALGERERSKEIGLRALHCTRVVLDHGFVGHDPGAAALLSVAELRDLDSRAQRRLIESRGEELAAAARVDYPVDVQHQIRGLTAVARPGVSARGSQAGTALAPGWAEGVLVAESDGEPGRILAGERVDGNYVLAVLPDGVVARFGSVLSHVAIVCRELGIPFVAGIDVDKADLGRTATVDGWQGELTVDRGRPGDGR